MHFPYANDWKRIDPLIQLATFDLSLKRVSTCVEQLLLALASFRTPFSLVALSNFGMMITVPKCSVGIEVRGDTCSRSGRRVVTSATHKL